MDFTIKLVGIYFSILGMTDYNWSMDNYGDLWLKIRWLFQITIWLFNIAMEIITFNRYIIYI